MCTCCNELDARLAALTSITASFAQSLWGAMNVSFPYIILPCLGIALSLYFALTARGATPNAVGYYLWFFMGQQVCSVWALYYWSVMSYDVLSICLNAFFLFTATVGVLASHRLEEVLRSSSLFAPLPLLLPVSV